jgi:hypothetical protein
MGRGLGKIKRTGRSEPIWAAIHTYKETAQGISLGSYLYLTLSKTLCCKCELM